MSADYERRLLARACELADLSDPRNNTLACLGAARHAGLDPEALTGLVGCAAALGASGTATYTAGEGWTGRHPDERHFLAHIHSIEDDLDEPIHAVIRLGKQASAPLDTARQDLEAAREKLAAARRQLAAAHAMLLRQPCDGCHDARAATIVAAQAAVHETEDLVRECEISTGICQDITRAAGVLVEQLRHAQARIRAIPHDLGETYESVYNLIRRGGVLPHDGRWLTGTGTPG
jgi:hypothetical protein